MASAPTARDLAPVALRAAFAAAFGETRRDRIDIIRA
jgi:hypothetical protein